MSTVATVAGRLRTWRGLSALAMFGATICYTASPQQLALTFDDGPNPAITPRLLDLLDQYDAKATFFVIGRFVRECQPLTKEIAVRGHLVANHTETHPNLFWLRPKAIRSEMQQCQDALQETLGAPAKYFRPPFGLRNPWVISTARELGMETVLWTLLPGDWRAKPVNGSLLECDPSRRMCETPRGASPATFCACMTARTANWAATVAARCGRSNIGCHAGATWV